MRISSSLGLPITLYNISGHKRIDAVLCQNEKTKSNQKNINPPRKLQTNKQFA